MSCMGSSTQSFRRISFRLLRKLLNHGTKWGFWGSKVGKPEPAAKRLLERFETAHGFQFRLGAVDRSSSQIRRQNAHLFSELSTGCLDFLWRKTCSESSDDDASILW